MAEHDPKTKISVEAVAHEAIRDLLQTICENHGVRIDQIEIDWEESSRIPITQFKMRGLRILSYTSTY